MYIHMCVQFHITCLISLRILIIMYSLFVKRSEGFFAAFLINIDSKNNNNYGIMTIKVGLAVCRYCLVTRRSTKQQ